MSKKIVSDKYLTKKEKKEISASVVHGRLPKIKLNARKRLQDIENQLNDPYNYLNDEFTDFINTMVQMVLHEKEKKNT